MNVWFDRASNLLIYPTIDHRIAQAIPETRVNGWHFAVPRTLRNLQVLRHFQYPIVPIMDDYDWPAPPGIKPYESQIVTANFLVTHPRCFCLSDMGVGKTNAALWAADWLMRQYKEPFRALIITPLSVLQRVWGDAIIRNFLDRRSYGILHGSAARRSSELDKPCDFYLCNFDGIGVGAHTTRGLKLDGFSARLKDRTDIRLVIIDEASAYKDSTTKRHRIARLVFGERDYLWLLTGTPTPTAPTDAYGLAKLCNNALGKSWTGFRLDTMYKPFPNSFKWLPKKDGYDKARELLQPAIRYDIKDVWDGPEMTTTQREVELTANQKKLMLELKNNFVLRMRSGQVITAVNEAAVRTKMLQISLGALYDANHDVHLTDAKPRIDELKAVVREAPGKLLVFASLTSVVELLYRELKEWSREIVYGDTSIADRNRIFSDFQDRELPRIIVADPGTMAHGLDLFRAQTVVWHGPTDKAELYAQANKRAHRPGQKYPVSIIQLVSNSLEREIFKRIETNQTLQGTLLDVIKRGDL